jgi:hypothetical protein
VVTAKAVAGAARAGPGRARVPAARSLLQVGAAPARCCDGWPASSSTSRGSVGGVVVVVLSPHRVSTEYPEYTEALGRAGPHAEFVPSTAAAGSGFVIGSRPT